MSEAVKTSMFISGCPITKSEAYRWIRQGIELTVIDVATNRPIDQKDGSVTVTGPQWTALAELVGGIISKIK